MQSLPYEILQHVASSLLPRYQCRLAMVSQYCYQYLYNDLLRWHAKKALIPLPVHDIIFKYTDETVLFTGKNVVLYNSINSKCRRFYSSVNTSNLSTRKSISLVRGPNKVTYVDYEISIQELYDITTRLPKKYINRYRKYLHTDIFLILVNRRSAPYLDRIGHSMIDKIYNNLSDEDIDNIATCEHLSIMLAG